jgi:hypothetical protein
MRELYRESTAGGTDLLKTAAHCRHPGFVVTVSGFGFGSP